MSRSPSPAGGRGGTLLYVLGKFPQPSETFVSQEVTSLRQAGLPIVAVSTSKRPAQHPTDDEVHTLMAGTIYPQGSAWHIGLTLAWTALLHPIRLGRLIQLNAGQAILPGRSRLARLARALLVLRTALERHATHLHGHWTMASDIAMLVARTIGVGYTFSAHAHDIYDEGPLLCRNGGHGSLEGKVAGARFVLCCSESGRRRLAELAGPAAAPRLLTHYHGVDTDRFAPGSRCDDGTPPRIVSVGRLVRYKGFDRLLEILALVAHQGYDFRCTIVGEGSQRSILEEQAARLGLMDHLRFAGRLAHAEVAVLLSNADLFILAADATAGQHGLPNVLAEAMSAGLATMATRLPAVPELIEDGVDGLLLPDTPDAAAGVVIRVISDPELRRRLGGAARDTVVTRFSRARQMAVLADRFRALLTENAA
jgi:glycosyltransferase involved in cell wall biosynthesis